MLVSDFAIPLFKELPIRDKTLKTYESVFRCHLHTDIGLLHLDKVQRADVQRVIKPLPPQIGSTTLAVCQTIFREAELRGLVETSPVNGVRGPRVQVAPRKFMTVEELERSDLGKFRTEILFLAYHGLRWGEAVALTEADIINGKISVTKSIHGPTKTRAGIRMIPQIKPFKEFPNNPKAIRRVLHGHGIHIHSLRHTYAYLLKSSGVHVTTAQRLMGHSDPKITLGIYTQFRDEEIDAAGSLIRKFSQPGYYLDNESELLLF
jgi:integrase